MRRGVHASYFIATLVILVVVILFGALVFKTLRDVWDTTEPDALCASQIRIHAATVQTTSDLKTPKIVCPTSRVTLMPDDDAREQIANAMMRCWTMWGKGKLQLFGKEEGAYCHVCSLITIPGGRPVTGLPEYLSTKKTRDGVSYAEALAGVKRGEYFQDETLKDFSKFSLETNKPIGVIFYYAKGQNFMDSVKNAVVGNPVGTAVAGAVVVGGAALYIASAIGTGGLTLVATGVIAGSAGFTGGFIGSLSARENLDTISTVIVRPLSEQDIKTLGCTYAPVSNE